MKDLLKKRINKLTVSDIKKALENVDDDTEVVLGFYRKKDGVHFGYLAEIQTNMKYDSVVKTKLESPIVELVCYQQEYVLENKNEL